MHDIDVDAKGLGLFNGDRAIFANGFHSLCDLLADNLITCGNGTNIRYLIFGGDFLRRSLDRIDHCLGCHFDTTTNAKRVSASGHVAQTLCHDHIGKQGCGGGAIACDIVGLHGCFTNELSAHVLHGILKVDLARYRNAVVGDERSAERALERNITALRTKRHLDCIGKLLNASSHTAAGICIEQNLFCH